MDAFLTFYGHAVPINPLILIEPQGDFPGRVLNKTRIFIGFLGDKLSSGRLSNEKIGDEAEASAISTSSSIHTGFVLRIVILARAR